MTNKLMHPVAGAALEAAIAYKALITPKSSIVEAAMKAVKEQRVKKLTSEEIGALRRSAEILEKLAQTPNHPKGEWMCNTAAQLRLVARDGERREST